jgi:hypothetical protein
LLATDLREQLFERVFLQHELGSVLELEIVVLCLHSQVSDLFFQASVYDPTSRERAIECLEQLGLLS